jgi:hypothetical protein
MKSQQKTSTTANDSNKGASEAENDTRTKTSEVTDNNRREFWGSYIGQSEAQGFGFSNI